jgi:superfamily II DNA or RNA helicase
MCKYRNLKRRYKNTFDSNIGGQLIEPCLSECTSYRRGTGYFSSSSLKTYANSLEHVIKDNVKIEILCSPVIQDKSLRDVLEVLVTDEDRHLKLIEESEEILLTAIGFKDSPDNLDYRSKILSYLISNGQLEIKFAIPLDYEELFEDVDYDALYHVKNGYFVFPNGDKVAFDGSFNESRLGHVKHRDRTQVFRSWVETDAPRLDDTIEDVDEEWNNTARDLKIYTLGDEILAIIKKLAPKKNPIKSKKENNNTIDWSHQEFAASKFIKAKKGILEMATGTGKTRTALNIVKQLFEEGEINSLIIETKGIPLLYQWNDAILKWKSEDASHVVSNINVFLEFDKNKDMSRYANITNNSILIVIRDATKLERLLNSTRVQNNAKKIMIVHDEVHGFGSKSMVENLKGSHKNFTYTLGLTATPDRDYDDGNEFIENEVGPVIYKFPIEKAIEKGILCEFNYFPLGFDYTEEDKAEILKIIRRYHASLKSGENYSKKKFYMQLSNVRKDAENKPETLDSFLKDNKDKLKSSIFFVNNTKQGEQIQSIIKKYTKSWGTFYQGTNNDLVELLSKKKLDAVIACTRLDEGVDIPSLENIFLISSSRAKLTTIQRIGRCLRIDPNNKDKVANVVDLILNDDDLGDDSDKADQVRRRWVLALSKIKKR